MLLRDELRAAARAHSDWGESLRAAVDSGEAALSIDLIEWEVDCKLGGWLHDPETPALRSCECYQHCRKAHQHFHETATGVIQRSRAGQVANPETEVGNESEFSRSLAALLEAVTDWSQHAALSKPTGNEIPPEPNRDTQLAAAPRGRA